MPYNVFDTGPDAKPFCVHKEDEDGEPIGKPLGCHATRQEAEAQLSALYANEAKSNGVCFTCAAHLLDGAGHEEWCPNKSKTVVHGPWGAVKSSKRLRTLEVLGVPFYGPDAGKDKQGEYFSPRTDIMLKPGDKRPVIYNHGLDPDNKAELRPRVIGEAEYLEKRADGHWFTVTVEDAYEEGERIVKAAVDGLARASSGAINYLVRTIRRTGEILVWPLAELTLIDYEAGKREPANDYAVANLKTVFEQAGLELPEAVTQAGEAKVAATEGEQSRSVHVDPNYLVEARRLRS